MPPAPDRSLHILVLTDREWKHPQGGGTGTNLHAQVARWLDWGHRVTIIASNFEGAEPLERDGALTVHRMGGRSTGPTGPSSSPSGRSSAISTGRAR